MVSQVERLLTVPMVQIGPIDPAHPHARHCLREYVAELDRRFPGGFDPARSISTDAPELRPPDGLLLVASLLSEPIGCGALKFHEGERGGDRPLPTAAREYDRRGSPLGGREGVVK
jgi:hypothetical protein